MKKNHLFILLSVICLTCGGYLLASQFSAGPGFPLDDAWIHQTYARNLVKIGQWAFIPGIPSAGSTAPLWSALLSISYVFTTGPFFWTYLLGSLSLAGLAVAGQIWFEKVSGMNTKIPWVGIFLAGEWHLVWSAMSGMETILYAFIVIFFFLVLIDSNEWLLGGLIAVSIWLRPDGITLLGPGFLVLVASRGVMIQRGIRMARMLVPVAGSVLLYALFNLSFSGSMLPNTFFAKQAEYSVLVTTPLFTRIFDLIKLPLIGAGLLLLPGFIYLAVDAFLKKNWAVISAYLWWLGFSILYALRLPVTYQYGRYLIPAMPVFFVLGLVGTGLIFETDKRTKLLRPLLEVPRKLDLQLLAWVGISTWRIILGVVWAAFLILGSNRYQGDVGIIQTEMVATANWISQNTAPDSRIAAHDIGALGFFAVRPVIDLAGLVSPEVIPFIRDEHRLICYLNDQGADYLVTFPGWYPEMVAGRKILFSTNGKYAPAQEGENMAVYAWP